MEFKNPDQVQQIAWELRTGDWSRGQNRSRINALFNGVPPYSDQEVEENNIAVNVNFLESTRIGHDARAQFASAFQKPGNYFKATTDMGPVHKRGDRSAIVTREINRIMKHSLDYYECFRSKFALDVLHGIGPAAWEDRDHWCPLPLGVEDLLVPADTRLGFRNLPFFVILRSLTAPELIRMTRGAIRDPAWNMPLVNECIRYVDKESMALLGQNYPEVWSPEKLEERVKSDGGYYMGDRVPTIDVFDFWYWSDEGKTSGWRRRMVLDNWSPPQGSSAASLNSKLEFGKDKWLYNPKNRRIASDHSEIFSCQFADLSSVAPFRYHSVRSLGFLLYATCHLQNRLRCKFSEAVFESLMVYFRVKTMDDVQRALKVDMVNRGFLDESISIVPGNERMQINEALVQLGLRENASLIREHSSSYSVNPNNMPDKREKTKFEVMAEVNSATALVSASLQQAYAYQVFEYREIFRRFCKESSRDPDVLKFRARCLRQGVPASLLTPEAWEIEPERVMGAGNKTLEMAISQQLMQYRNLYDPEPQRQILRDVTLAITDDAARAAALVPDQPVTVTNSVHDAQLAAGTLMQGLPVAIKTGMNHIEYVDTLLASMAIIISKIQKSGGVGTMDQLSGLGNINAHIGQHIAIIAQDPEEKQRVKIYGDQLGKMMNLVKAFAQRLQEQMQKSNGGARVDPEMQVKIQAQERMAQIKADSTAKSHAQRTAQRQVQFEMEEKRKQLTHEQDLKIQAQEAALKVASEQLTLDAKEKADASKPKSEE